MDGHGDAGDQAPPIPPGRAAPDAGGMTAGGVTEGMAGGVAGTGTDGCADTRLRAVRTARDPDTGAGVWMRRDAYALNDETASA